MKNDQFNAWKDKEHAKIFDYLSIFPNFLVKYHYDLLNESKLLKQNIKDIKGNKIFEIGCATGELYRYFKKKYKKLNYLGFDISFPAINRAKFKYDKNKFILLKPKEIFNIKTKFGTPNIVWSRDVVMHQKNPYKFIKFLVNLSSEATVIKLRTRDIGKTVFDANKSCQLHWDRHWAPYIVLNMYELIKKISANKEVNKIFISRNYQVLGGHYLRYLPKELYYKNSKTAETSVLILKGKRKSNKVKVLYYDRKEDDYNYFYRIIRKIYTISKNLIK